jgi:hypothetical protein
MFSGQNAIVTFSGKCCIVVKMFFTHWLECVAVKMFVLLCICLCLFLSVVVKMLVSPWLACVCVCDRIFAEKMFLAIQNYVLVFIALSSLTSHIIKSSCINYTSLGKIKERSFPSHAICLSQFLSLISTWTSRFFLVSWPPWGRATCTPLL